MKKVSLGIPLAVGMTGTVLSLAVGTKKIHTVFGVAWTALSLIHFYQHKKIMKNNVKKGLGQMNILSAVGIPTSKMDWFLRSVTVGSYIPGRIRVYSKALVNNHKLKVKVEEAMAKYVELDNVSINLLSGSVLIEYQPNKIKTNKELCEIEAYIKKRANK